MITITVLIAHYEDFECLVRCLSSLVCQARLPTEVIIVDDCSKNCDFTSLSLSSFPFDVRITSLLHNSSGPSVPRNIGIDLTSTSHIIFLDCDDILTPFVIDDYHKEWSSSPKTLLFGHAYYWNNTRVTYLRDRPYLNKVSYKNLLKRGNYLVLSGMGGNINTFKENRFDINQIWEDFDLWIRLSKQGFCFKYMGISTFYENKEVSRSSSKQSRRKGLIQFTLKHFNIRFLMRLGVWTFKNLI